MFWIKVAVFLIFCGFLQFPQLNAAILPYSLDHFSVPHSTHIALILHFIAFVLRYVR